MKREPDLAALRALTVVAQQGSISAASGLLGVSQQAVSLRIRSLETDLRLRLLSRSARGSWLTPAGEVVVGWATALLGAADEFSAAVDSLRADRGRTMRIHASLTVAEHLLPEWIARWRSLVGEGGPVVQLTAANSTSVVDAVRTGSTDLGFIETPTVPADLGTLTVGRDSIEVVVPRAHRWAQTGRVSARELAATRLVVRETGSGTRQALEEAMNAAGCPLTASPAAVVSTTLGIRSAIMSGVAPGALSSLAVAEDIRTGRLARVRIRNLSITRPLTAIWAGRTPPPSVRGFVEAITPAPV